MINNSITIFLEYYIYLKTSLSFILLKPKKIITIFNVKQKDIFLNRILKNGLNKNLDDFLRIP